MRFLQQWILRLWSSGIWHHITWQMVNNVWRKKLPPSSGTSVLKMETAHSSEILLTIYQTITSQRTVLAILAFCLSKQHFKKWTGYQNETFSYLYILEILFNMCPSLPPNEGNHMKQIFVLWNFHFLHEYCSCSKYISAFT